jgi:hypothetical protein
VAPKFVPVIVIAVPGAPEAWLAVLIAGAVGLGDVEAELVQPEIPRESATMRSSIHNALLPSGEPLVERVTEKSADWAASCMV